MRNNNHYREEYDQFGSSRYAGGFFTRHLSGMISNIIYPIERLIDQQKRNLRRQITAIFLGIIGWIFLLHGLAIVINNLLGDGRWPGYVAIGFVLLLISLVKNRE